MVSVESKSTEKPKQLDEKIDTVVCEDAPPKALCCWKRVFRTFMENTTAHGYGHSVLMYPSCRKVAVVIFLISVTASTMGWYMGVRTMLSMTEKEYYESKVGGCRPFMIVSV